MVFLAGRELSDAITLLTTAIAPNCDHSRGRVWADRSAVGVVAREAQGHALAVLAQVHTHPGASTRHSFGDDRMILMPFESMLSIVVPHYGHFGMRPLSSLGVHQFQDGGWRPCDPASVAEAITIVPGSVDLR
jgi:proteasome lid subunit RPN8/RPN11